MASRGVYTAEQRYRAALAALVTAVDRLAAAADEAPEDPQAVFELVTRAADDLTTEYRKLIGAFSVIRARQVQRIWDAEELTLAELGQRIGGLTKQRAKKMLQVAAGQEDPQPPEEDQP